MECPAAALPSQEQAANAAIAAPAAAEAGAEAAATASSGKSKNQRKKANRKAKARAANATVTALLAQCNALRHGTVMGEWLRAFHRFKGAYRAYYVAASDLSEECLEWIFLLTKINMQRMYQRTPGWGWNDKGQNNGLAKKLRCTAPHRCAQTWAATWRRADWRSHAALVLFSLFLGCCVSHSEKRAESRHPDARYLIVTQVEASDDAAASAAAAAGPSPSAAAAASPGAPDEPVVFEGTPIGFCAIRFVTGDEDHAPIAYVYAHTHAHTHPAHLILGRTCDARAQTTMR